MSHQSSLPAPAAVRFNDRMQQTGGTPHPPAQPGSRCPPARRPTAWPGQPAAVGSRLVPVVKMPFNSGQAYLPSQSRRFHMACLTEAAANEMPAGTLRNACLLLQVLDLGVQVRNAGGLVLQTSIAERAVSRDGWALMGRLQESPAMPSTAQFHAWPPYQQQCPWPLNSSNASPPQHSAGSSRQWSVGRPPARC